MRFSLLISVSALCFTVPLYAQDADKSDNAEIVVTARRLDQSRDSISTSIGASEYRFNRDALDNQPGGADRNLKGVLLQAPGITQDSDGDGDVHIRNEHGNVQYRLNGIVVPQGFAGFGASVDPRIASSIDIITGALPAQYGFHTAGVVALKTRTDSFDFDGDAGLYGGANGTIQPSVTIRNSSGKLNYFASASYLRNDLGISNPAPTRGAIHDRTEQYRGFGFASYILTDSTRLTAFGGLSVGHFQIPNRAGELPGFAVNGKVAFDSAQLDQNQRQTAAFGVVAFQHDGETLDYVIAPFFRTAHVHYTPDPKGGLLFFSGTDTDLVQLSRAFGLQADASLKWGERHTMRFGIAAQFERTRANSLTRVFSADANGAQLSDIPFGITTNERSKGDLFGIYVQDEWKLSDTLTLNYGLRYDRVKTFATEDQVSPRVGLVWKPDDVFTLHAGYSRNFTPPPLERITGSTLSAFQGTTAEAASLIADPVRAEREHYLDAGLQRVFGGRLTLGLDVYYKFKTNLLDDEQFGSTLLQSPFNYARAFGWGVELSANYEHGPLEFYANVARGEQRAREIISNQFFFEHDELAYIANNDIFTDHSQAWTISGGGAFKIDNQWGELRPSFDFIYGDGLRAGDPAGIVPNGGKQSPYLQVNFGISQSFASKRKKEDAILLRLDVINLFDKLYLIHDGSGVGAGQPEYGPRRAVMLGVRFAF